MQASADPVPRGPLWHRAAGATRTTRMPARPERSEPPAGAAPTTVPARGTPTRPDATASDPRASAVNEGPGRPRKRIVLIAAAAVAAVVGLAYYLHSRGFEETDDAQIDGNISAISPRVPGTVIAVHAGENQEVKVGDLLAEVDPTDLQVQVVQAKAAVAQAEAQLQAEDPSVSITESSNTAALAGASSELASSQAGVSAAQAQVEQLTAQLAEADANARNADLERQRGEQLIRAQAIPQAEYDRRVNAAAAARAAVDALKQSLAATRDRVNQQKAQLTAVRSRLTEVRANAPRQVETRKASVQFRQANLELARAQLSQATLNLGYAKLRAPVAGVVAKKAINIGDHVAPGQQVIAIAQTGNLWVTANFRETQLRRMRPGQKVTVHVDAIDTDLRATVESLGGATGSRLSVLPPENATGNYVKVVQRIPVRIKLDAGQAGLERLRPGMSVEPEVDVR